MKLRLVFVIFYSLFFTAQPAWSTTNNTGSGIQSDPYRVTDCSQLQEIRNDLSAHYILLNDIDCSETVSWNDGAGFDPIGGPFFGPGFRGTIDGQNYLVKHLYIKREDQFGVGLFGRVVNAQINNIGLEEVNITGLGRTGGLVGEANDSTIEHCYVTGNVNASEEALGGLIGNSGSNLRVNRSYSTAKVTSSSNEVGGLIGYIWFGSISDSYATGNVVGNDEVGGLVGWNNGPIDNTYSIGTVSGNVFVGGLVGRTGNPTIENPPIVNSYWDIQTSEQSSSAGGTGKTTAEMKLQSTFSGWDFESIWSICEGVTYPWLQWQDISCFEIDIKPGNKHNIINPRANGGIWVAILSNTNPDTPFDPSSQVDIPTVGFGPDGAKATRYKVKDINNDGLGDLLLRFKIPETGVACGDTEAALTGNTFDGQSFTGTDSLKTVGCKFKKCHKKKHHKKHHHMHGDRKYHKMHHKKHHDDYHDGDKRHHGKDNEKKQNKKRRDDDHDDDHKKH